MLLVSGALLSSVPLTASSTGGTTQASEQEVPQSGCLLHRGGGQAPGRQTRLNF